jgi:hypothetical protein
LSLEKNIMWLPTPTFLRTECYSEWEARGRCGYIQSMGLLTVVSELCILTNLLYFHCRNRVNA